MKYKRPAQWVDIENEMVWTIPLTRGLFIIVDECDIDLAFDNWHALGKGYGARIENHERILLHRVILVRALGVLPEGEWYCKHLNNDVQDNRRSNLQIIYKQKTAKRLKGTIIRKRRWGARITINGNTRRLGGYATEEAGHDAYMNAKYC